MKLSNLILFKMKKLTLPFHLLKNLRFDKMDIKDFLIGKTVEQQIGY